MKFPDKKYNTIVIDPPWNIKNIAWGFWSKFISPVIKELKGNKCENCGSTKMLDLHHFDYEKVNINTLRLLCRKCHKKEHEKKRSSP